MLGIGHLSAGVLLAVWLLSGLPAALATARLDGLPGTLVVGLLGPVTWAAWVLARRHADDAKVAACQQRFLGRV